MVYCQNCGKENENGTSFCRFCGNRFNLAQTQNINDEYTPPRPYMWKTDEFQVKNYSAPRTTEIKQVEPIYQPVPNYPGNNKITHHQPNNFVAGYRCPRCGTQNLPYLKRQISTAGWITFAVLLVTTGIFFWIGLLMKEDVKVCSVCNYQLNP